MNRDTCGQCDAPCELCKCEALGALEYELWGVVTGGADAAAAADAAAQAKAAEEEQK